MKTVAVIGLGYVGLPVACLCTTQGYNVFGADIDEKKISLIKKGVCPIKDDYLENQFKKVKDRIKVTLKVEEAVRQADIVIICVPTPVDKKNLPDLTALKSATTSVSNSMRDNTLIVIESTIYPGTTEEVILPILKKSNVNNFYLAHCPERIDPGNKNFTIEKIPRVVSGINKESSAKAYEFYKKIVSVPVTELKSIKAAEATKMMENTFRDVNVAFINEMAKSFDKAGIDIIDVIKGASTKPFAFMPHYPGTGVGGHCIPVDPYYLIEKAKQIGFNHKFLNLAREINDSMPNYEDELILINLSGVSSFCLPFIFKRKDKKIEFQKKLEEKGIETRPMISGNLLKQPFLSKYYNPNDFKNSDYIHEHAFYIGNNQFVNSERLARLERIMKDFFNC